MSATQHCTFSCTLSNRGPWLSEHLKEGLHPVFENLTAIQRNEPAHCPNPLGLKSCQVELCQLQSFSSRPLLLAGHQSKLAAPTSTSPLVTAHFSPRKRQESWLRGPTPWSAALRNLLRMVSRILPLPVWRLPWFQIQGRESGGGGRRTGGRAQHHRPCGADG